MQIMNIAQLENHIEANVKGTTFVSLLSETAVKMVKKHRETKEPNPYLGTIKRQKKNGMIGFDYENSVNNQAKREDKDEREAKPRAWGVLSDSRLFVHHKGNSYLQLKLQSATDTVYLFNGEEIPFEVIKPYLSATKTSSTQADLDKEIVVNDINLLNIKALTMKGETFMLTASIAKTEQEKETVTKTTETETA